MEQFYSELSKANILLSNQQKEQLEKYFHFLVEKNKVMNLTGITDVEGVYWKHFYDSLTPLFYHQLQGAHICDIGSGAGFPGIVLAIVEPTLTLTIIDSLQKRIHFLEDLCKHLELKNVTCIHARAEDIAQDAAFRSQYDFVFARAVARLNMLVELCGAFVKKNGYFVAMKASKTDEEISESQNALTTMGLNITSVEQLTIPYFNEPRTLVMMQKIKEPSKKYPRSFGKIKNSPL